jgi:hypothetical protein
MGRPKLYRDNAEKQAAYRQRKSGKAVVKLATLREQFLELRKNINRVRRETNDELRESRTFLAFRDSLEQRNVLEHRLNYILKYIKEELDRFGTKIS